MAEENSNVRLSPQAEYVRKCTEYFLYHEKLKPVDELGYNVQQIADYLAKNGGKLNVSMAWEALEELCDSGFARNTTRKHGQDSSGLVPEPRYDFPGYVELMERMGKRLERNKKETELISIMCDTCAKHNPDKRKKKN